MLIHDFIKHGPRDFECRVCGKTWQRHPQAACPGVKVYDIRNHAPFMTQKELAYLGYRTSAHAMPPEVGCYYSHGGSRYIYLYDAIHAIPKTRRHGVPEAITEVFWPLIYLPLLDSIHDMEALHFSSMIEAEKFIQRQNEITNIAAMTGAFTHAQMEQMAGDIVVLKIPPTILYRFYPTESTNREEENKMRTNLLIAYRRHTAMSQSLS